MRTVQLRTHTMIEHVRTFEPHPGILAFYDGRVDGHRFMQGANWVDDGAITLGIASYALVSGTHALVYDTHVSKAHASFIRETLASRGVTQITVVLSHWHLDHVAGTEMFADCEIIANQKTFAHLSKQRKKIEAGTLDGPPGILPLVLPNSMFESRKTIHIGALCVELIEANIHSDDATVIWIEELGILFAGDTMEDTVTYVSEPQNFKIHLSELDRLAELNANFILPCHGQPDVIASGGYNSNLLKAQQQYIKVLERCRYDLKLRELPLEDLIAESLSKGWVKLFEPYREVHAENIRSVANLDG